jgi:DNA polymerase III subunit delta'
MAFRDIIGQDRAINILVRTIQRGRIASSYLFAGEPGIGKKYTAVTLAKGLNCLTSPGDACDECPSCKKIDSGIHPDFLRISPESGQIRIEEIRAIDEMLSLKAFEGRYKVVIVDDADTMNQHAANAFLKTLEEPPAESLIILVSSNPCRLPDTIRSRCSRINFTPLSSSACEKVILNVLRQKLDAPEYSSTHSRIQGGEAGGKGKRPLKNKREEEKKKGKEESVKIVSLPDPLTLSLLIRLSMGSPGNAITQDIIADRSWSMQLLKGMLNTEKDGWTSKEDMERWFDLILILLRDMAVFRITGNESRLINVDLKEYIRGMSSATDIKGIIESYQRMNALKRYFGVHLNKSLTWNYTGSLLRKIMDVTNA